MKQSVLGHINLRLTIDEIVTINQALTTKRTQLETALSENHAESIKELLRVDLEQTQKLQLYLGEKHKLLSKELAK